MFGSISPLAIIALAIVTWTVSLGIKFWNNVTSARGTGLPYICMPIYHLNAFWRATASLWTPLLRLLPTPITQSWLKFTDPDFIWIEGYQPFEDFGRDGFIIVSPFANILVLADPEALVHIMSKLESFPKPLERYKILDLFGKNIISTEGATWRRYRKAIAACFGEQNNRLVWEEAIEQTKSMIAGWKKHGESDSGRLTDCHDQFMRLSLNVISRAGFGEKFYWPHESTDDAAPAGHTLTYQQALSSLVRHLVIILVTPRWMLQYSPFKVHRQALLAYNEWHQYLLEAVEKERENVNSVSSETSQILMGALVHATKESDEPDSSALSATEVIGNAFVLILAGHDTVAHSFHFALMYLAMNPSSLKALQASLDEIFGDKPVSDWDYERHLAALSNSMCAAVMNEQLRMLPPVIDIPKSVSSRAAQKLVIGNQEYLIPASCVISLSVVGLHRNPKFWPHTSQSDLENFRPERWLVDERSEGSEKKDSKNVDAPRTTDKQNVDSLQEGLFQPFKGAYVPFSHGQRACIGRRFAQTELLAGLAVICKDWSVELDVGEWLSDESFGRATDQERRAAWNFAHTKATRLLKTNMKTLITLQMQGDDVPLRFVRRGNERFVFD